MKPKNLRLDDQLFDRLQDLANKTFNGNMTKLITWFCYHGLATLDEDVIKLVEEDANYVSKK